MYPDPLKQVYIGLAHLHPLIYKWGILGIHQSLIYWVFRLNYCSSNKYVSWPLDCVFVGSRHSQYMCLKTLNTFAYECETKLLLSDKVELETKATGIAEKVRSTFLFDVLNKKHFLALRVW